MKSVLNSNSSPATRDRRAALAERLRRAAAGARGMTMSFAQQRLWFLDQLEPNSPLYNVPIVMELTGRLDATALQRALDALVARHEILRTRFVCPDETPLQVVEAAAAAPIQFCDLGHLAVPDAEARALVRTEVNRPFHVSEAPLMRAMLLRLGADRHWFVLNLHHIVSDEWSLKVLFRDLGELYRCFLAGGAPALPELPIQYADFALWQREWLRGPVLEQQMAYWRQALQGNPPVLELPADRVRPAAPRYRGRSVRRALPESLCDALRVLAARHESTLFMLLLTAFKTLLHRYTQQEDIVIGSPIAGRNRVETEELIGFFVNTLLLRTDLSGNPSFEGLLRRVRETTLGAYAHQDLPFERLVEELRPERTLNHMPFTSVMFAVQDRGPDGLSWPDLTLRSLDVESDTTKFDLTFVVQETGRGLVAAAEYNIDLFEAESIERLLQRFETLLGSIASDPARRIAELPWLTEAERRMVMVDWNDTATPYPERACIHELFEAQARRTPDAVALAFGDETVTFGELNARANQLARRLKALSVGPDVPVGVCVERSPDLVLAMLGILKAGGAYVPLDPSHPKRRLAFMMGDAGVPVLLTQQRLLDQAPRGAARVVCLDSDWDLIGRESRENVPNAATPESLAYVIYTSGSTGEPKGVAVPHRAVVRLVRDTNYIQFTSADRVAQASNASFDAATFEIWGALLNGARLVGIPRDLALSPKDFARELSEREVSVLFLTTALFNQVAADVPDAFKTVRVVLFGGETVDPKWVRTVLQSGPPERLLHVYGPTENTTFSTWHEVKDTGAEAHTIPIGRPISNTRCYVLDAHLNPVPVGVPGELYLAGAGLARGYLNRPDLSAQRFIPNPLRKGDGFELLYRTGDLVRWRPDGNLEFLGRADQQVKIRGFRVELGEIETVLSRHSQVRDCAVAVCENGNGHSKLVAYVVASGRSDPAASELRQYLQDKLPDYMLPSAFVRLPGLPLTPNGKVDRKALPQPDKARPELERKYASPRDAVELKLTEIWENVLGVQPVGIEDRFFDLGGHSLLAVRLIAQMEKAFGKRLKLATIFQAQTIEQLAAIIREEIQEGNAIARTSVVEIQGQGTRPPLFFIHGAGGGMFWGYVNLSRRLGPEQPMYGLKSRGLDGREELGSIEAMAEQYVADIRAVQPTGPYYLGGYCFGGNVAFEAARQLEAQGETVALLALMNCAPANSRYTRIYWTPKWALRFARNLLYWFRYYSNWTPLQRRDFFRWKKQVLRRRIGRLLKSSSGALAMVDAGELVDLSSFSAEQRKLWEAHIRALIRYRPGSYSGRVHLFRSPGHPLLCSFDTDYGWGEFARGGVEIAVVPGVHEKILEEPCVSALAERLRETLNAAPGSGNGNPAANGAAAMFRKVVLRAGLLWLGTESGAFLDHAAAPEGVGLAMLFQQLSGVCRSKTSDRRRDDNDAASDDPTEQSDPGKGKPEAAHPEVVSDGNRSECLVLSGGVHGQLAALSGQENVPLSLTLMAAAKSLLHRYSPPTNADQDALSPAQATADSETVFRCSIHELMLRMDLSDDPSFRELLRRLRRDSGCADGFHEGSEAGGEGSGLEGHATPLFKVAFDIRRAGGMESSQRNGKAARGFDLIFGFERSGSNLIARVDYNPALFDAGSVVRLLGHLETLLGGIASEPDREISQLPLLTSNERRQLLVEWNATAASFPNDRPYAELFEAQAARAPSAVAARYRGAELTYGELNQRANQLASHLRGLGVGPDVLVGICLERSLDLLVALLGILKAGGAYVPLDPAYPGERLNYMLADSGVGLLLTDSSLAARFPECPARIICLNEAAVREEINRRPSDTVPTAATADNLAYVIYTSGSTGQPKGVPITQRSLLNHNFAVVRAYGLQDSDRVMQFTPLSFDISVEEIFPTWLAGGAVVARTDDDLSSLDRFLEFVGRERLTVLNLPTAYWHELVEHVQKSVLPETVRLVVIGGEKASDEAWCRWKARVDGRVTLINSYGPTEATVISTLHVGRADERTLPIGRPIANVQTLILDAHLQPVPVGVAGELYIGGAGLSRGYLNRPELTAGRFIPNPFPEVPCDRLYKTGDLARFREDGTIEFVGRADEQVKIRGFRIELGEIESALCAHAGVKNVAVIAREDAPGKKKLVAYFVPRESQPPGVSDLLAFLKQKLPAYMVPSAFVRLPALPLTPAGKVDRRALPRPGTERPELEQQFMAPRTPIEEVLAGIWSEVLGLNRVGVQDNFFDLGGHSLLATQVISRVRDSLQVDLPLVTLFERATIAELAAHLADASRPVQPVLPVSAVAKGRQLPLSPAQKRIWFLDEFDPQQSAYNIATAFRVSGALDLPALERSLTELVRRHEALRTIFPVQNGELVQIVCEARDIHLEITDLQEVPEAERESRAREIVAQEARKSYVISSPMLRPVLLQLSRTEHWLLLVTHQLACDLHSMRVVFDELTALYESFASGRTPDLSPVPVDYAETLAATRVSSDDEQRQLGYWRRRLEGAPLLLEVPADHARPACQGDAGARVPVSLPADVVRGLKQLAHDNGCSLFAALTAVFKTLLSRYTGATDVVVGSTVSMRTRPELRNLVGNFENWIALRTSLDGDPTFTGLLERVRETTEGALAHSTLPFEKLLETLQPPRNTSYTPVTQVSIVLQSETLPSRSVAGARFNPFAVDGQTARMDLGLHLEEGPGGLAGWIEYSRNLFERPRIERMIEHFGMLLKSAVAHPGERISRLPMLPEPERRQLLDLWTATEREYPGDRTLAQLFEEQAERTPDAVALVAGAERLTYAELNAQASRIAQRLQAEGVGPEVLVAVCLNRSWQLVAGILGVLKAGGAYVPLDPAYPAERLSFILEDARAPVLLTSLEDKGKWQKTNGKVICVEEVLSEPLISTSLHSGRENGSPEPQSPPRRDRSAVGANLAYVIYTSGSTGRPKGVAIEHRSAVGLVHWARRVFPVEELSGVLASTSICFDLSVFELFVPLCCGGKVILVENALALPGLPAAGEVTLINTVPSAIRELLRIDGIPGNVQVVNLAGEALSAGLVDEIYERTSVLKVYDLYGPTETTTYSTGALRGRGEAATIGRPLDNEEVYILDGCGQLAPIGVPGELHIGGEGLAREYLNRPELMAEKFIGHPFKAGARLYRTGDLARWREDGNLEYLGRIDRQVKLRGFRIEPGEIESALRTHPGVRDAAVIVREDRPEDRRLVGYVVPAADAAPGGDLLRPFLKERLPEYMVPSDFVVLAALPLTPNGKVDRRALPAPEAGEMESTGFVAPRTTMEESLAAIWADVLGRNHIGVRENFFDIGGHSLLAIRVISRVRESFKVDLPLFSVFDAPTIEEMSDGLLTGRWTQNRKPVLPMHRASRDGELPASLMQEGLWFIDQLEPGNSAYNVPSLVRLKGRLEREHLQRALDRIVERHEALRTALVFSGNQVAQMIAPPEPVALRITDLRDAPPGEREERARELARRDAREPFDLGHGPLTRYHLICLGEEDHLFCVVIHHTMCDGCSIAIFFSELEALYNASVAGQAADVADLPLQFADFARWQREWMQGAVLAGEVEFWKRSLAGAPISIALPTDFPEPENGSRRCGACTVNLPRELVGRMTALAQREGGTPFMVLMAGLAYVLHKWTEQRDLVIGTVVAGRNRREIENVMGCFINFLPIRVKPGFESTGLTLFEQVKATVFEAQAHQDCPFERIVEALNPARGAIQNPLYNVTLLFQNFERIGLDAAGLTSEFLPLTPEASPVDLEFEAEQNDRGITMKCEYRTDLFHHETVERLLAVYRGFLEQWLDRPEAELAALPAVRDLQPIARKAVDKQVVAIAATFTAEPIDEPVQYWMRELELAAEIRFASYGQVFQQLLDPAGLFAKNPRGLNVVLVRVEDWERDEPQPGRASEAKIRQAAQELAVAVKTAAARNGSPHLVCICPSPKAAAVPGRARFFEDVEASLAADLRAIDGVHVVTARELAEAYPVNDVYDPRGDELGHVPYTPVFFAALGTMIARKFHALQRAPHKVIVLDCDQTLWSGVCGEDGPDGIRLDAPRRALQQFMKEQLDAGMLLCLASKNSEADVEAVFAKRTEMPLRREHFVARRLNWRPKSANLRELAGELQLGLDSLVFIDDNPVECAEVEANCPEVLTLQLPEDVESIPDFLRHCWVFDRLKVTAEDRSRSDLYRQNREREALRSTSMTLADFVAGLHLQVEIGRMSDDQLSRVAQLTQRTNQFNCTTRRRTETEVRSLSGGCEVLATSVRDRFGDYGLVGVVICSPAPDALEVETFLLSCRVLGRGVEHAMLARAGAMARERGLERVDVRFDPTARNQPALDFLESVGASFRQSFNGGSVFRFPAEYAAGIVFRPPDTSGGNIGARESAAVSAPGGAAPRKFAHCRRIALEGRDPAAIQRRIESRAVSRSVRQTGYVAPRTGLQEKLCALWARLLRLDRVGIHDDFFDLGGHSLMAVRLFAEIEKLTGRKFPLVTLFQAPTVEQLSRVIDEQETASRSPIVVIQPNGTRPPLFLVHGAGGDVVWGYANLAKHLDPDQPVFGIKSRGQVGLEEYDSIEAMAGYYLEEVRAFQPRGPYYLGGYCFGGNVAYEMARQLHVQGERVALLALLDTAPSNAGYETVPWWKPSFAPRFVRNLRCWLGDFRQQSGADQRRFIARKLRTLARKIAGRCRGRRGADAVDLEEVIDLSHFPEHELKLWQVHIRALTLHVERPYHGAVTLFRTRGQPLFCSLEEDFCWSRLARGGVSLKRIPGSHENIFMEPNVKCLAEALEQALAEARTKNHQPVEEARAA